MLTIVETIRRDPLRLLRARTLSLVRTRLIAGLFAAALALTACGGDDGNSSAATPADLLSFQAQTVAGDSVDVSDYVGSDLVIWFWAPW